MMFLAGRLNRALQRRKEIKDFVAQNPGAHVARMARELEIPRTSLMHHLARMGRHGELTMVGHGSNLRALPRDALLQALDELVVMDYPASRKAEDLLRDNGAMRLLEIGNALDLTRKQAQTTMDRLLKVGLVDRERQFRGRYFIADLTPER